MKAYFAFLVSCSVLLTGVLCVEPYPAPAEVDASQHEQRQQRPQRTSLFDFFPRLVDSPIVEVPFRGFGDRWKAMDMMMRYLDGQMDDFMRDVQALIPIDRDTEEWCVNHPIITEKNGTRIFKVKLDMRQFKPEEISLNVNFGVLSVNARQESKTDHSTVFRQYSRQFPLPDGVIVDELRSTLSPEGVMIITAPMVDEDDIEEEESKGEEEGAEGEEQKEEEEEEEDSITTVSPTELPITASPTLPEIVLEVNPNQEKEKKEETINIINETHE